MICSICGQRFAEFSEKDFRFVEGQGFFPKHDKAEENRKRVYANDEIGICSEECAEILTLRTEAQINYDSYVPLFPCMGE